MHHDRRNSNSYKLAVIKDGYGSSYKRWAKRQASKAVRRYQGELPDGAAYKRLYDSWNICDFCFDQAHDDSIRDWYVWHYRFGGKNYFSK